VAEFRAEAGRGCNITVPFKFQAAPLASELTPRATLAQACNVLRFDGERVLADNTDGLGLVDDIERNAGVALRGRDVLLLGAGGAAAGVLGPLVEAGPRRVVVANRTRAKALALVQRHVPLAAQHRVELAGCGLDEVSGRFDVVVNGTASSLAGAEVPVDAAVLKPGALACDMMYGPAAAGFAEWARAHGAVPRDGLGMLVEQAAEAFLFWRGVPPALGPGTGRTARHRGLTAMRALLRWLLLIVPGMFALQLYFLLRIAAMAYVNPQSTTFQRSEAWRYRKRKRQAALAPAMGAPMPRFRRT
jgi:shikimate dehydrogenase